MQEIEQRRKQVQEEAVAQAVGTDRSVRIKCSDFCHLLQMRDATGRPLTAIQYSEATGLQPLFMGKPIAWL